MTSRAENSVAIERRIDASPEIVFSFFTDPERYRRWQGKQAELDPRPDGVFRVTVSGRTRTVASGRFIRVEPSRRITFTWGWEQADGLPDDMRVPPGTTTVDVELIPDGDGTLVRLRHGDLPSAPARHFHSWGWDLSFDRLVLVAQGRPPGPDPFADM